MLVVFQFMFVLSIFMFVCVRYNDVMSFTPRQVDIMFRARELGRVSVDALSRDFGVTAQTIRRDLRELCDSGHLDRTHGGAALPSGITNIAYEDRRRVNADAKEAIGQATAALIQPGASLFIGIGTTTEAVARALRDTPNLMVVTNNLNAAQILSAHPSAEVIVTGGRLRRSDGGLVGEMAVQTLQQFKLDYAVIGTSAMDIQGVLLDYDPDEVRVSQAILKQCRTAVLVADLGKLERTAPVRITNLARMDHWVTDKPPSWGMQLDCKNNHVRITVPGHAL